MYIIKKTEVKAMVKDTIKAVKAAENSAAKLAKETSEKQERMLRDAKQKVVSQKEEMESELLEMREKALKDTARQNEGLMEQAVAKAKEEALLLRKQAALKQTEAFQLILTELV